MSRARAALQRIVSFNGRTSTEVEILREIARRALSEIDYDAAEDKRRTTTTERQ